MKLYNLIKTGLLKLVNSDQKTGEVSYLSGDQEAVIFSPYGLYVYPDTKIPCIVLQANAEEDNLIAIPHDPDSKPTLEKGDVGLVTSNGKMTVMLHKDGTIEIKGESKEVLATISTALGHISSFIDKIGSQTLTVTGSAETVPPASVTGTATFSPGAFDIDKANVDGDQDDIDTMKVQND